MKAKVIKHLKGDIKTFKKEIDDDKGLIKTLKRKSHKNHEKQEKADNKLKSSFKRKNKRK